MILQIVALDEGLTVDEIKGPLRLPDFVAARNLAIHLVHKANPTWSTPTLGDFFGGRDHTSIMHSLRKVTAELEGRKYVAKRYGKAARK
jgi:chromosomal replication initiator protein